MNIAKAKAKPAAKTAPPARKLQGHQPAPAAGPLPPPPAPAPKHTVGRYVDLRARLEALTKEVEHARATETREAIATCKELITMFDLTQYDLFGKVQQIPPQKNGAHTFPAKKPKVTFPPKYRNPDTGQTWSGRGHTPQWLTGNRDDWLIEPQHAKQTAEQQQEQPA